MPIEKLGTSVEFGGNVTREGMFNKFTGGERLSYRGAETERTRLPLLKNPKVCRPSSAAKRQIGESTVSPLMSASNRTSQASHAMHAPRPPNPSILARQGLEESRSSKVDVSPDEKRYPDGEFSRIHSMKMDSERQAGETKLDLEVPATSDAETALFLAQMRERFSPGAVAERMSASRRRVTEGYEAVLTFELILENPINENDPELDRMLESKGPAVRNMAAASAAGDRRHAAPQHRPMGVTSRGTRDKV